MANKHYQSPSDALRKRISNVELKNDKGDNFSLDSEQFKYYPETVYTGAAAEAESVKYFGQGGDNLIVSIGPFHLSL